MQQPGDDRVIGADLEDEMRKAYLDYSMSVIVARALPDVRDGLKPVQRRILYGMHEMGLRNDRPFRKCAAIVGEVVRERSRSIETHGTVARASDGALMAEAEATFLLMPDERRRELERRYSRTDETFARVRAAVAAEEAMEHGRT